MRKMNKGKILITMLVLFLISSIFVVPVFAESSSFSNTKNILGAQSKLYETALTGTITPDLENRISIGNPQFTVMSNYNVNGDLLDHSDSLTTEDSTDFYFFSVPDTRSAIFRILSSNPNYRVDLYEIDWDTNTAYPVGLGGTSGNDLFANGLYAADWGLMVTSTGTVGDTYSIQMNVSSPGGATSLMKTSGALQSTVWGYSNGDLYLNENYIASTTQAVNTNPHLNWERKFYFTSGGNYQSRDHDISDARVSHITTRANYISDYASSDNAVLIVLKEETLFTYFESVYRSGPPVYHNYSFVDTTGRTTPRRLDWIDTAGNPDILVYDLNTNQVIDFVSNLNYYHSKGIEPSPTVIYYN